MSGRRALAVAACAALLLAAIELFQAALLSSPPDGVLPHGVPAESRQLRMAAVYGGFAREAAEGGGILAHNHHTAEAHPPILARPKEWVVGRTLALFGIDPVHAMRVERAYAVPIFVLGIWALGRTLLRRVSSAWALLAACCLGGTLLWLPPLIPGLAERPELWRSWLGPPSVANTGLGYAYSGLLLGGPHLMLEVGWFAAALALGVRAARDRDVRLSLLCGLCILALCSVRPYTVPIALAAVGAAELPNLFDRKHLRGACLRVVALGLPPLPLVVHLAGVITGDTVFASLDVVHLAPPLHEIALFIGLPAFLLPIAAVLAWRAGARLRWSHGTCAVVGWTVVQLALVHGSPVIQWEVEPMLPLLALVTLGAIAGFERASVRPWVAVGLVALHAVGGAAWLDDLWGRRDDPAGGLYILESEYRALEALSELRPPDSMTADRSPAVLVCNEGLGALVPWLGGARVVVGHRDHTPDHTRLTGLQRRFLAAGEGGAILRNIGATLVLAGPREGPALRERARTAPELAPLWIEGDVGILRLIEPGEPRRREGAER